MTYSLQRERDSAGDSGQMSLGLVPVYDENSVPIDLNYEHNCRPRVGIVMRVGSLTAQSYSYQDYWQTTLITEIIDETENCVKFRTGNSVYTWEIF